jgi:hypothetical protein
MDRLLFDQEVKNQKWTCALSELNSSLTQASLVRTNIFSCLRLFDFLLTGAPGGINSVLPA